MLYEDVPLVRDMFSKERPTPSLTEKEEMVCLRTVFHNFRVKLISGYNPK